MYIAVGGTGGSGITGATGQSGATGETGSTGGTGGGLDVVTIASHGMQAEFSHTLHDRSLCHIRMMA